MIWKKRIKDDDMENDVFGVIIFVACVSFICLIPFSIDIPCALRGGQEMYVNELPSYTGFGKFQRTITDNEELKRLKGCNWAFSEKYGDYRICYTKVTKIVLDIEKLD
ncbi:hypothetical protein FMM68_11620 [Lachnospiraceae bacterium MD329]|nr:hypothetical protein [Lachnospiraceae bacterium MD329]